MTPPIASARAGLVSQIGDAIPDSQLIRNVDNNSASETGDGGPVVNPNFKLNGLKAEISQNTSGATTAYIRDSNDNILGQTDISGLSSGDTFRVDAVSMSAGSDYILSLDAQGSTYTLGFLDSPSYDYLTDAFDIVRQRRPDDGEDTGAFPAVNNVRTLDY